MFTALPLYDITASAVVVDETPAPWSGETHTMRKVRSFNMPGNCPARLPMVSVCDLSFHEIGIVA